jgi:hypothetical protein
MARADSIIPVGTDARAPRKISAANAPYIIEKTMAAHKNPSKRTPTAIGSTKYAQINQTKGGTALTTSTKAVASKKGKSAAFRIKTINKKRPIADPNTEEITVSKTVVYRPLIIDGKKGEIEENSIR